MKIPGISSERLTAIFSKQSRLMQSTDSFNLKAIQNETKNVNRVAIITGKKNISKSAVIRNRSDRRIKSALQTVYPTLKMKGYDFMYFSKPPVVTVPWTTLMEQVKSSMAALEKKAATKK
ncbi:hypothetical protein BD408DRAFT_418312 [Parasitella parasitica]|nr:hypothetical protein BD408DRAFT_418312 [Parasitella parasitica]